MPDGLHHPQGNADGVRDDSAQDAEVQGNGNALLDHVPHRLVIFKGIAHGALKQAVKAGLVHHGAPRVALRLVLDGCRIVRLPHAARPAFRPVQGGFNVHGPAFRGGFPGRRAGKKGILHAPGIFVRTDYDDLFPGFIQVDPGVRIGNAGIFILLVGRFHAADVSELLTGDENLFRKHSQPLQIGGNDGLLEAVLFFQPLHIRFTQVIVSALGARFLAGQGAHALLLHHLLNGTSRDKAGYAKDEERDPQERQGHEKESSDDIGLHSSRRTLLVCGRRGK